MNRIHLTVFVLVSSLTTACTQQQINIDHLKTHVAYLSSDSLLGRGTGEAGSEKAAQYIEREFQKTNLLAKGTSGFRQAFPVRKNANPHQTDTTSPSKTAENVIGFLDNGSEKTIVIGAHYDHLGLGDQGGSLDPEPRGKIHNGADDNASGTAGLLELARFFSQNGVKEKNNFLFIGFSGEELGLLGSKAFTQNPTFDLTRVSLMINMDMIGRLDSSKRLQVMGTGTSPVLEDLVKKKNSTFQLKTDSSGVGPSDHTSFYLKNIPVLHFFTGSHTDYHKPGDDAEKINYEGEKEVLDFIVRIVTEIDTISKLVFTPTRNTNNDNAPRFKVTLGVLPDYSYTGGLKIDAVTEGKPGHAAGLMAGDVIVAMGEHNVTDIQTYMQALGKFKKSESTTVRVKRGSTELTVKVTF